jgi:hypothetical protein
VAKGESLRSKNVRTGGGERSNDEFILFPPEKGMTTIRPESVVFRWKVTSEKRLNLSVKITGKYKAIWSKEVAGEGGSFTSRDLTEALENVRRRQPLAKLQLRLGVASLGTENSANFQLLSLRAEKQLRRELAGTTGEQGVFKHLRRAEIYSRYGLYIEVANEYEKALVLSPESVDLLYALASAQDRVGNLKRRDEIEAQIKAQANSN